MTFQYKGRGFLQGTGRNSMAIANSPITINGQSLSQSLKNINNVTLSNTSAGYSASPWDLTFADQHSHPNLKRYEVFESTESIISLSVAKNRLWTDSATFYKLTDKDLYNKVTPEDRTKAEEIKNYYSKKIMMLKLKGNGQLTKFREDLNNLVHSDGLVFKEEMLGIAYSLPYFYKYDTELDEVLMQVNKNQKFSEIIAKGGPASLRITETLTPIKRIIHRTKHSKKVQYWMKDSKLDAGVLIELGEKNPLQHLWDYIFDTEKSIKIVGNYARRKLDDFEYFSVEKWEIDRG
jgi:hypothetical protein